LFRHSAFGIRYFPLILASSFVILTSWGCSPVSKPEAPPAAADGGRSPPVPAVPAAAAVAAGEKPAVRAPSVFTTKTGVQMVRIPGGEFVMGDEAGEEDERPVRTLRISPFYIDRSEVTQASYRALMGKNPAKWPDPERPADRVSWVSAVQYCNMRSLREGLKPCYDPRAFACDFSADGYRLPTEAEWEYACRAGTRGRWSFGDEPGKLDDYGWSKGNSARSTHPVCQKRPNPWGLYDMHGNLAEWCNDYYAERYDAAQTLDPHGPASGDERVLRGGSWNASPESCRSAARHSQPPGLADTCFGYEAYGFRCVRKAEGR
jgi:formylglycine-generating enzyme required for sulfatase activity